METYITLAEAARRLGIRHTSARNAALRGALRAVKAGRDWFVTPAEVERYRRERRAGRPPGRSKP